MKHTPILLLIAATLSSCTSAGPNGVIAFGTNASHVRWTPQEVVINDMNNSTSFQAGTNLVSTGIVTAGTVAISKDFVAGLTSTKNAETAAGTAAVRSKEITKRALSADKVKTQAILHPPEPAPLP